MRNVNHGMATPGLASRKFGSHCKARASLLAIIIGLASRNATYILRINGEAGDAATRKFLKGSYLRFSSLLDSRLDLASQPPDSGSKALIQIRNPLIDVLTPFL